MDKKIAMSRIINILILTAFYFAATAQTDIKPVDLSFDQKSIELGDVKRGDKETFKYHFTNIGTEAIEIAIVSGCDCTTLDWTRGEIAPGEQGVIDVIFDSTEKEQSETVDVDIYLKNINPKSESQYLFILDYTFNLLQ